MDKVQNLESINTAPSSKTFRDESYTVVDCFWIETSRTPVLHLKKLWSMKCFNKLDYIRQVAVLVHFKMSSKH
jgi:hypothetical protein